MKRLVILLLIVISVTSISKAQSVVKINIDNLPAEVSVKAPTINLDCDAMMVDIRNNIAGIENASDLIDLSSLNDLSHIEKTINSIQYEITSAVSDTNTGNAYAYANKGNAKGENSLTYSYTTAESPQNNDALFSSLSNIKGVDVVYISKTMLGMMPDMNMPGVDIGNIARKLESIEIYSAEEESTSKRLTYASEALLKSGDYETLMLMKDNGSKTAFYMKKNKSNQGSEMLMITEDGNDATIIRFLGSFSVQDIKNLANQSNGININSSVNINTSNRLSEAELEMRTKEAQKRNEEAQKIAEQAQKRAIEAQRKAEKALEQAKRAEERGREAENRGKEAEERAKERARKTN